MTELHALLEASADKIVGWQPIETAPRDGSPVLLTATHFPSGEPIRYRVAVGWWNDRQIVEYGKTRDESEWVGWSQLIDLIQMRGASGKAELFTRSMSGDYHPPTHWMPFPTPPEVTSV